MSKPLPAENHTISRDRWDAFLDAYLDYLQDPTPMNAAVLHLAGAALESHGERFSLAEFKSRLDLVESV